MLKRFLFKKRKYQHLQFLFQFHYWSFDASLLARKLILRKLHGFHAIHAMMLLPRVLRKLIGCITVVLKSLRLKLVYL